MPFLFFITALQAALERHDWTTFDEPPLMAQGGKGEVVIGRRECRVAIYVVAEFMRHLTGDVLPRAVRAAVRNEKDYRKLEVGVMAKLGCCTFVRTD